jgi:hypothetical protein
LGSKRLRLLPGRRVALTLLAVRHSGNRFGDASVPQEPALGGVVNQVAVVGDRERLADIDAGRPARLVGADAFAAIHDIHFIDIGLGLSKTRLSKQDHRKRRGRQKTGELHESLPLDHREVDDRGPMFP